MSAWASTIPPAPGDLPADLARHPRLSQWLGFAERGRVVVTPGKVEIGQGILTALAQIVADELDIDLDRVRMIPASTDRSPDQGVTSGSLSVQQCGLALRMACADVRAFLLDRAADRLGTTPSGLRVEDGTVIGPGNLRTDYWDLAGDEALDRAVTGSARPKPAASRTVSGTSAARLDAADKVFGARRFIHDLLLPDTLHGRVLRPDRPGATLAGLDEEAVRRCPGVVALVRDGSFLGIVAGTEDEAEAALLRLAAAATWSGGADLPDEAALDGWLRAAPAELTVLDRVGDEPAPDGGTRVRRDYGRPFIAHASAAPSCALARFDDDGTVRVWTHSQGIFNLRADIALVLRCPLDRIVVSHVEGAGCYGHNGADDAALDAVLLARAVPDRPVRLRWSRADELARAPVGPAMSIRVEAALGPDGAVKDWHHEIWSNGAVLRPGRGNVPVLRAASEIADPFPVVVANDPPAASGGGSDRNAAPSYAFPRRTVLRHRLLSMPIRTSSLRSLGAFGNVFAAESFMDELAAEAGADPLAFRLRHLDDPRGRAVLERAAAMAGWVERGRLAPGQGLGLGYARYKGTGAYCAVAALVEADETVRVRRLFVSVDVGEVVNPDGVENQVEGGAVQATSWTLKEAVRFDRERITSDSWDAYPILRFSDVPAVAVAILPRPDDPPLGAGEAAQGPTAAAIANGLAAALGIRVRHLPLTRDNILRAIETGDT